MKKTSIFFALSFLGALALQNASSEEPKPYKPKPYNEAYSEEELRIIKSGKYGRYGLYSEEPRIIRLVNPDNKRYVLWRVQTLPFDNSSGKMYATVDSVLREDFYAKEKFYLIKDEKRRKQNSRPR